jgi:hypothetical protein
MAVVPVPEAAVHKQNSSVARKNKIRTTGQVFSMQPKPKSRLVQFGSDQQLRFRVLAPDA